MITFLNFSASESCRDGVNSVCEVLLTTLPVGLDFRVSIGDRQNPVTCSAVFRRFSISKELVLELTFILESVKLDVVTSVSTEYLSLPRRTLRRFKKDFAFSPSLQMGF